MNENKNFREHLEINYLYNLAIQDYKDAFLSFYDNYKENIKKSMNGDTSIVLLEKVKKIIGYRMALIEDYQRKM